MTGGAQAATLPGGRLHLHHGPIDLIIGVEGPERVACFERAAARFSTLLERLVADLPALRRPLDGQAFRDPVARRMARAVAPHEGFVTPMAAVAGAVADEVLAAMLAGGAAPRAYVNNGGDIAFHLDPGQVFRSAGVVGQIEVRAETPARGLATSGWGGRSHSLGIADAVSVVAETAAAADVAATLIANAVDLPGHSAISRVPAHDLTPDSDLGARPVTIAVQALERAEIDAALEAGLRRARAMQAAGLIEQAVLRLQSVQVATHEEGALAYA